MRPVVAVVALALLAGCGTPGDATPVSVAVRATPEALADAVQAAENAIAEDTETHSATPEPTPSEPVPVAAAPGDVYPDLAPGETTTIWGEMPLSIELTPAACATIGTSMRAVIRTVPDALIGGAVRYADGNPHDDWTWGRAPTGEFVWTWTIKPGVPMGPAKAMVTAGKRGESGGAVMAQFEVSEAC